MNAKELIARRVALELHDGDVVNLGIGLPTLVVNYLPADVRITLQSENGFLGLGPVTEPDPALVNAGGQPCGMVPGASTFDSAFSFALIRGGHVDACVLGGLQVAENGDLANWMVPGMGGAMDLVAGAKRVIVAMEHSAKDGSAKLVRVCTLPLTAQRCVSVVVTELALFEFVDGVLTLHELAPGVDLTTVREKTEAVFAISPDLKTMPIDTH
jgi:acetate CoA/acetoacetate CoA-transferase beta subunit